MLDMFYIILLDQPLCNTTLLWTLMVCCHSCDLQVLSHPSMSYYVWALLKWDMDLCYIFLAIWWTYIAVYVGMVLRSTKLVSPALSSNISDSHLCRNLQCCNYSIKVILSGVGIHKGDFPCHRLGGHKECRKTPCFGDAWWCDCMKTGVQTGSFLSACLR